MFRVSYFVTLVHARVSKVHEDYDTMRRFCRGYNHSIPRSPRIFRHLGRRLPRTAQPDLLLQMAPPQLGRGTPDNRKSRSCNPTDSEATTTPVVEMTIAERTAGNEFYYLYSACGPLPLKSPKDRWTNGGMVLRRYKGGGNMEPSYAVCPMPLRSRNGRRKIRHPSWTTTIEERKQPSVKPESAAAGQEI